MSLLLTCACILPQQKVVKGILEVTHKHIRYTRGTRALVFVAMRGLGSWTGDRMTGVCVCGVCCVLSVCSKAGDPKASAELVAALQQFNAVCDAVHVELVR